MQSKESKETSSQARRSAISLQSIFYSFGIASFIAFLAYLALPSTSQENRNDLFIPFAGTALICLLSGWLIASVSSLIGIAKEIMKLYKNPENKREIIKEIGINSGILLGIIFLTAVFLNYMKDVFSL